MLSDEYCETLTNQAEPALENDVHAPDKFRVNGPLTQYDEFSKAWQCSDKAIMNPPNRCGGGSGPLW
jgi:predicted metalloendopeptidase